MSSEYAHISLIKIQTECLELLWVDSCYPCYRFKPGLPGFSSTLSSPVCFRKILCVSETHKHQRTDMLLQLNLVKPLHKSSQMNC